MGTSYGNAVRMRPRCNLHAGVLQFEQTKRLLPTRTHGLEPQHICRESFKSIDCISPALATRAIAEDSMSGKRIRRCWDHGAYAARLLTGHPHSAFYEFFSEVAKEDMPEESMNSYR